MVAFILTLAELVLDLQAGNPSVQICQSFPAFSFEYGVHQLSNAGD